MEVSIAVQRASEAQYQSRRPGSGSGLGKSELLSQAIFQKVESIAEIARLTGLAWSAVQERLKPSRRWDPKLGRFVPLI